MTSDPRNSSADENASVAKPNWRSRSGSDSRTDSSSSTTETSAWLTFMSALSLCRVRIAVWIAENGERGIFLDCARFRATARVLQAALGPRRGQGSAMRVGGCDGMHQIAGDA